MSIVYNWKNVIKNDELNKVCNILKNDGIVIFPTETVYGIGGNALSDKAIKKIFEAKKRPENKALSILLKNKNEISKYAEITSDFERKIIDKLMPGPITLILKMKKNIIASNATCENDTIGIRIPKSKIIQEILQNCSFPIAAPSANISGMPSGVKFSDVIDDFKDAVDILIDGGTCEQSISSTIVKVEGEKIKILREGSISKKEIDDIIKSN